MEETNKNPIQVADKLFAVLEILACNKSMSIAELSTALVINKPTVHRLLNSLMYLGYVGQETETSRYYLSFKIWGLANQLISHMDIIDTVRPFLRELVSTTEETVHLVKREDINAIYIDKMESETNAVRLVSQVGKSIPLYCSGVGKALLANMTDIQIKEIWDASTIKALTSHTITSYKDFINEINQVRRLGYAIDNEENEPGVRCVAVALSHKSTPASYAVSISAPINRMNKERLKQLGDMALQFKSNVDSTLGI